ncbi:MAG: hypothetical protein ACYCX6_12100 [Vulcanimicrobiaceae bacterium]
MNFIDRVNEWLLQRYVRQQTGVDDTGAPPEATARYRKEMRSAFLLLFVLFVAGESIRIFSPNWPWHQLEAMPEILASILALAAMVRYTATWDELQRRIFVESGAFAALGAGIFLLDAAFLKRRGSTPISPTVELAVLVALWGIAWIFVRRRYQ